ncbi:MULTISPECIES: hypothetical protein [Sphingobacterium]|uniref:hypothetical protein n=1 Tax=Sphingobacterium TaxID=28453 RepID=UPI00257D3F90|nr:MULTISPECIES: hypothetical protein [Sphingobacterium]
MDDKVKALLFAYLKLTPSQKSSFREELEKLERGSLYEQRTYSEKLEKSLGPLFSGACPTCGK